MHDLPCLFAGWLRAAFTSTLEIEMVSENMRSWDSDLNAFRKLRLSTLRRRDRLACWHLSGSAAALLVQCAVESPGWVKLFSFRV